MRFILLLFFGVIFLQGQSQSLSNLHSKESKKFNFGIGLGVGFHALGIEKSNAYLAQEKWVSINPNSTAGFFVHFVSNYNFKPHWALRFNFPLFHYSNYTIAYTQRDGANTKNESFIFDHFKLNAPIEVLFKSDIINNFRFHISSGYYAGYNFTSNVALKNISFLRINKWEQGATIGIGFTFGGEFTNTAVELKYQYGFTDIFIQEANNDFSNVIEKLKTRNLLLSISF